MKCTKILMT